MAQTALPYLGFGLGLRTKHYPYIFDQKPAVDWFEIISENFMDTDGKPKRNLARIKEHCPIVMHGVALSIGTVDPLNSDYLQKLKALADWVQPAWISDHLCWTGVAHKNTHDLLPVPYTEEALKHIVQRIKEVQDYLERPIALENPSTYLEFKSSSMPEAEFIARMANDSGCNLLLDINNVFVSCYNHRLDVKTYLDALPLNRVIQIHLSGHSNRGTHIIDTHDDFVVGEVWEMYKYVVHKAGRTPNTMIEWDDHIPEFSVLLAELEKARTAAAASAIHVLPSLAQPHAAAQQSDRPALADQQVHMQKAIMLGKDYNSGPEAWIKDKQDFAPQAQLNVYVNAYRFRLNDVVAEDYPVLAHYLGRTAFNKLVWDFVNLEQPDHFNIARYAAKLPGFVAKSLPDDLFAYELCTLETAVSQVGDGQETQPLEQHHLDGVSADNLLDSKLHPRAALQLLEFRYPVNAYYCAVMDEEDPQPPTLAASFVSVFRHEDTVWRMDLSEAEYRLLEKLFSGMTVGAALADMNEAAAGEITVWFSRWIRNGLLAASDYSTLVRKKPYEAA